MSFCLLSLATICLFILDSLSVEYDCNITKKATGILSSSSPQAISNFESGSHKLIPSQIGKRYNNYNITLNQSFNTTNEIAISLQNIQSFAPTNSLDFFIKAKNKGNLLEIMLVMDIGAKWSFVKIYYALSQRNDLIVGNFIANNNFFLLQKNTTKYEIEHFLPKTINEISQYIYVLPFINGLKTFDQNLTLSIVRAFANMTNRKLSLTLQIKYDLYPLQHIYISYMLVNMISQLEIINFHYSPSMAYLSNTFAGLTQIRPISQINQNKTNNVKGLFRNPFAQDNLDTMFGVNGIILQTQQSLDILFLSPQTKNTTQERYTCISKIQCAQLKGRMTYDQQNVFNIISICVVCMKNALYSDSLKICVCKQGYINKQGTCIQSIACPKNQTYNELKKQCLCSPLYINRTNLCQSIFELCDSDEIFYKNKCYKIKYKDISLANCPNHTIFIHRSCVDIKNCTNSIYNHTTNECSCPSEQYMLDNVCVKCQDNQMWNGTTCICKEQFSKVEGKCVKCDSKAFFNGKGCQCFKTYIGDGFNCTLSAQDKSKPLNFYYGLSGIFLNKKSNP